VALPTKRTNEGGLAGRLRDAGYRLTRQRLAVLTAVEESATGLSAAELLEAARRHCEQVGLATVYRTLDLLDEIGGAERVHTRHAGSAFVGCPPTDHHHVVCLSCGKVADFGGCVVADMLPAVAAQTGFTVESHVLELRGICRDCRQAGPEVSKRPRQAVRGRRSRVERECSSGGGGRAI